jgi:2-hydroxychromene-2-carboxylate isomerase
VTAVDFHFDVMCPWAYQTSLWIREAARVRPIELSWRFFSLEEVNREPGKKHPWERPWSYGWSLMRVGARLGREDPALVGEWYLAAGRALHEDGRKVHTRPVAEEVVAEMGLDAALVGEALDDPATHQAVRADHQRVVDAGGFGVPTLFLEGGACLFGPVVAPAPRGEDAGRLWDLVAGWQEFPHLYELRRPKTAADLDHIAAAFAPTFEARDWRSVQNPVP